MEIYIQRMVVHILDNTLGVPILSNHVHPLSVETNEFVAKHIEKLFADSRLKKSYFLGENNEMQSICMDIKHDNALFLEKSQVMADKLYQIMLLYLDIPSADVVFNLILIGDVQYMVILKLNYKTSYIHFLDNQEGIQVNSIIQQKTTLPSATQKVEEAIAINLESMEISMIENRYEMEEEKGFYLSPIFLNCGVDVSSKEKIKQLEKTANHIIDQYYGEDELEKRFAFKAAINEHVEESQAIDVAEVAQKVFGHLPQVRDTYLAEVNQKGIQSESIPIVHQTEGEYYKQQRLITDTGIEIKLPINEYDNKDKIEFITNKDGTLSILIKNIKNIRK